MACATILCIAHVATAKLCEPVRIIVQCLSIPCLLPSSAPSTCRRSPSRTRQFLREKRFAPETIESAIFDAYHHDSAKASAEVGTSYDVYDDNVLCSDDVNIARIVDVVERRYCRGAIDVTDSWDEMQKLRRRMSSWLVYRGHSSGVISRVIRCVEERMSERSNDSAALDDGGVGWRGD